MKRLFVFNLFLFVFCLRLFAKDVSSIQQRINVAKDGDVVFVDDGIYSSGTIKIQRNFKKIVTIVPKNIGKVIFQGNVSIRILNSNNVKIQGFYFNKVSNSSIVLSNSSFVEIHNNYFGSCGSSPTQSIIRLARDNRNVSISNNTFDNSKAQSIAIFTPRDNFQPDKNKYNIIKNNVFRNIKRVRDVYPQSNTTNGMEAIMLGTGYQNTIVYDLGNQVIGNIFKNIYADGLETVSIKSSGSIVESNQFIDCESGITIRMANNVRVSKNLFKNTRKGLRIFGNNHVVNDNFFERNFYAILLPSTDSDKVIGKAGYMKQNKLLIENNYFISSVKAVLEMNSGNYEYSVPEFVFENNIISGNIRINNHRVRHTVSSSMISKFKRSSLAAAKSSNNYYSDWSKSVGRKFNGKGGCLWLK